MTHNQQMMVFAIKCNIDDGRADVAAKLATSLAHQMRPSFRTWSGWNAVQTKLLQKRNAAQRIISDSWKSDDPSKEQARGERALARALAAIAEHEMHYVPSTATFNICNPSLRG